ncbi:MAG TPA: hypothetical protein VME63_11200 [Dyella sp.]|uniref:hypothetical protein n=1 Tax=Dyella sp. TaxID=1869338 RepID=UPI002C83726A|nr:hypothetical protein [Dyella sp.]HTV85970.1 hypothetical protein [Dyella sp.]
MNPMMAVLIVAGVLCCDTIYSINDLNSPIRYVDKQQGYFIGIKKNEFIIGTAIADIKNLANDLPQADGHVENCSSHGFRCRSIGYFVFAIPNGEHRSAEYIAGPRISIKRLANGGWRGSATCSMITRTGCARHVDVNKLVVAYQYDVSSTGILKSVKIQNWNDSGQLLNTQNLILVSEIGLKLN